MQSFPDGRLENFLVPGGEHKWPIRLLFTGPNESGHVKAIVLKRLLLGNTTSTSAAADAKSKADKKDKMEEEETEKKTNPKQPTTAGD